MTGSAPQFFLAKTAVRWNRGICRGETLQGTSLQLLYSGLPIATASVARYPSSRAANRSLCPAGPWSNLWLGGTVEAVLFHEFSNSDRRPESEYRFSLRITVFANQGFCNSRNML